MDAWLNLFRRAVAVIDAAPVGTVPDDWTLGGGTMLFRRFGHRQSRDIDIFVSSPQSLPALSPRLNAVAESLTEPPAGYVEQSHFVKLTFPDGDVDFIVAPHLMCPFATRERIEGREVWVETPAEILAKKVLYRSADFTARDLFDLAFLIDTGDADALMAEPGTYGPRLTEIVARVERDSTMLEPAFAAIATVSFRPSYASCVGVARNFALRPEWAGG